MSEAAKSHKKLMTGQKKQGHFSALNISLVDCGDDWAEMSLTPTAALIGDPSTGALHSGPITTLLDSALGIAASLALPRLGFAPTIDLRVDHLRMANAQEPLIARGEVVRITRNVLFAKGSVRQGNIEIAHAVGNFVRLSDEVLAITEAHIQQQLEAMDSGVEL